MARTATVKLGVFEAVFDGQVFASADESTANVLNSALAAYRAGVREIKGLDYWPDEFRNLAQRIAEYGGGELVSVDPPEGEEAPEGAVY